MYTEYFVARLQKLAGLTLFYEDLVSIFTVLIRSNFVPIGFFKILEVITLLPAFCFLLKICCKRTLVLL